MEEEEEEEEGGEFKKYEGSNRERTNFNAGSSKSILRV